MDEDFMNELQELTKQMGKELEIEKSQNKSVQQNSTQNSQQQFQLPNSLFKMNLEGSEEDCVKELEKLLQMGMNMDLDENDPQTSDMMKLLNDNLKDLEGKMQDMQKNLIIPEIQNLDKKIEEPLQHEQKLNPEKENSTKKSSNPFVDTFKQMSDNPLEGNLMDFMKLFEQGAGNEETNLGDIKNLYDILGKLSDNKENENTGEKGKHLESLFGDLLDFLLKSDMLSEPLTQIKTSVISYLDKHKDLKQEDEDKYKSMLNYIDTIMEEIQKKEPNKAMVIEVFYKLHELSDIDGEILSENDSAFKQFSSLFSNK